MWTLHAAVWGWALTLCLVPLLQQSAAVVLGAHMKGTQCSFCVASDTLRCELQKALSAGGSPVLGLSHLPGPAGLTWLLCSHGACMGAQWSHTRILQQK